MRLILERVEHGEDLVLDLYLSEHPHDPAPSALATSGQAWSGALGSVVSQ
jgi:hypothetical protein